MNELEQLAAAARLAPTHPPKNRRGFPVIGVTFMVVTLVALAVAITHLASRNSSPEQVRAAALYRDFADDQVAAEGRWKGRYIDVKGRISDIGVDDVSRLGVLLDGEHALNGVVVKMRDAADRSRLLIGELVVLRGRCQGRRVAVVELTDGVIVERAP